MKLLRIRQDRLIFYKNRVIGTGLDNKNTESSFFGHLKNLIRDYLGLDFSISTTLTKDQNSIPDFIVSFMGTPKTKIISKDFRKYRLEDMLSNPNLDDEAHRLRKHCYINQLDNSLVIITDFLCFWIVEPTSIKNDPDSAEYEPVQIMQKLRLFEWDEHDLLSLSLIPDAPIVLKMLINLIRIYADFRITVPTDLYDFIIPFIRPSQYICNLPKEIQYILENPESPEEIRFQDFLSTLLNEIHAYLSDETIKEYGIQLFDLYSHMIIENVIATWMQFNQESSQDPTQTVFSIDRFTYHIPIDSDVIIHLPDGKKYEKCVPAFREVETTNIPSKLLYNILKPIEKCLNNTDYHVLIRNFNFNDPFYNDLYKKLKEKYGQTNRSANNQNDFITGIINSINIFLSEKSTIHQWIQDPEICYAIVLEGYLIPSFFHLL